MPRAHLVGEVDGAAEVHSARREDGGQGARRRAAEVDPVHGDGVLEGDDGADLPKVKDAWRRMVCLREALIVAYGEYDDT